MPDSISVRIVCWDGHGYNQSSFLWLLLIIVAFVGNGDSKHVRGEQDSYEGLQYTLSNYPTFENLMLWQIIQSSNLLFDAIVI